MFDQTQDQRHMVTGSMIAETCAAYAWIRVREQPDGKIAERNRPIGTACRLAP